MYLHKMKSDSSRKEERKHRKRARDGEVTVDVDKLWAELSSVPVGRVVLAPPDLKEDDVELDKDHNKENAPAQSNEETITIKRRIEYAGEVTEVEERVPRNSKEAQKYLAEHPEADPSSKQAEADPSGLQRPLKRPSMFEPNPIGLVKGVAPEKLRPRAPSRLDVLMATKRAEDKKNAQTMSTVPKSALDWRGYVDQEGLREELDEYGKSRGGFLAREAFLDRAAGAREQAARDARLRL
jgi:type IV secretory pathway VirB10-like protein